MERHEILEAMGELKLHGMRASFDEIAGKGLARRDELYPLIASLIRAERTHRQARSISYRIAGAKFPVLKDKRQVRLRRYPGRRGPSSRTRRRRLPRRQAQRNLHRWNGHGQNPSLHRRGFRGHSRPRQRALLQSGRPRQSARTRKGRRPLRPTIGKPAAIRSHRHRRTRISPVQPAWRTVAVPSDQQALRKHLAADHHQSRLR
jgi:hypothetical protein